MSTLVLQETLKNVNVPKSTASIRPVPTSSSSKIQNVDNQMYVKRGSAKRKSDSFVEEAVNAIKTLCQPDLITPDVTTP